MAHSCSGHRRDYKSTKLQSKAVKMSYLRTELMKWDSSQHCT